MKKRIAILLAAALSVGSGFPAYAMEPGAPGQMRQEREEGAGAPDGGNMPEAAAAVETDDVGQVDVSIGAAMIFGSPVDFAVKLTGASGYESHGVIDIGGDAASEGRLSFEGLAGGEYALEVSAKGFARYRQEFTVEDGAYAFNLMTGFLGGDGIRYEKGFPHPGVLLIGDVNGDGVVDEMDKSVLIDAMEGTEYIAEADLSGDGKVDLVDLEYFSRGYQEIRDTQATIQKSIPAAAIGAAAGENTVIEGDLNELLRNNSSVSLTPLGGGEISESNPVELEFNFDSVGNAAAADGVLIETGGDNPVSKAIVTIEQEGEEPLVIPVVDGVEYLLRNAEEVRTERDGNGNIIIYLGGQIAVKKVTLTIVGMRNNNNLAEISKVEFVNGMEERIPEPEMDIPQGLTATAGNKKVSLTWEPCVNITGYEIEITQGEGNAAVSETVIVARNVFELTSFKGKELVNYQEYRIRVQSVNGGWRSGYSAEVKATPKPDSKPAAPDNVGATGGYQSIEVSWKSMKDTLSYNVYYKEGAGGEYQKISDITTTRCTITGLKDLTEYTIYVTGSNELGEGAASRTVSAATTDLNPAIMPKYGLINGGEKGEIKHIIDTAMWGGMEDSPLDAEAGTAWGTVDHDPSSYYIKKSWDDGGYNPVGGYLKQYNGLLYEFDDVYKMDTIALHDLTSRDNGFGYVKVRYWDEDGNAVNLGNVQLQKAQDADGRRYYVIKLPEAVYAKKIQFGIARAAASGNITVAEVYFYHYDELTDEIMALYEDDLHTVLRPDVTKETIEELRVKLHAKDEENDAYHPDMELLERELDTAQEILEQGDKLSESVRIYSSISTNDVNRGFGGLNAWQPLGIVAAAQEEILVFVGHNTKRTGDATNLQLVATQYHAESGAMSSGGIALKVGVNKITVPRIGSASDAEAGGALYIQYTGTNANDAYAVRVSGGVRVPKLDLYHVEGHEERLARTTAYVKELAAYIQQIKTKHEEIHDGAENKLVDLAYDRKNCILGASDILLDAMMFSLPAEQIYNGAKGTGIEEKAESILASMDAMEDMMHLFYQHKGLSSTAPEALNQTPKGHLNIRYQRMFAGAFMYAAGNHIGIEWDSAAGMVTAVPVVDDNGLWESGRYFGWGIAHEIGHCINQGTYAIAEITNNYYSVLAQAHDSNGTVRFSYDKVYEKVTSGAKGRASNVFTQLGMYWQLHLAYDKGYNYKTYEDYQEQLDNLFFARVDTYARNTAKAPAPDGVALKLEGDTDQKLMRLACAAAEKNILEFFERWGMTPNEGTRMYAEQFEEETRAIYYVCDDSRRYSLENGGSRLGEEGNVEAVGEVSAQINAEIANQVDISLSFENIPSDDFLGYEIVRCMISNGVTEKEPVGFTGKNLFSDIINVNNRVVWYEVTVIDKYLNRSAVKTVSPLKVEYDGSLDKSTWTVSTQNLEVEGESGAVSGSTGCSSSREELEGTDDAQETASAQKMIDNDLSSVYSAAVKGNAEIILTFNKEQTVSGFKYNVGAGMSGDYEIQVCISGDWKKVAEGAFGEDKNNSVYFASEDYSQERGGYVCTYAATAVKLVLKNQNGSQASIAELDVLGPTSDNVDFRRTDDGSVAIGKMPEDYVFGDKEGNLIPAGSIVFTGSYKGNPAYNVVILFDEDGGIVGGEVDGVLLAQQVILADVPDKGNILNVSDGTWIYWIEPGQLTDLAGKKVRAELYRVNNAQTNEGQRLVSDSLFVAVPEELPDIVINDTK